jgi:hypothetical protein
MGKPRTPTVVHYDASVKQAEASMKGMELLNRAQGEAYTSGRVSSLLGDEALTANRLGITLLGEYLKDRNKAMSNQVPIDADYYQKTSDIGAKYAAKASSLFGGS